jgi:hypothetical protein
MGFGLIIGFIGFVSYEYAWPFVKWTYRTYDMLLKILLFALYTSPLPVQALQSRSCLSYLCYNDSLVTWTAVSLTTAKFKPPIFSVRRCLPLYCLMAEAEAEACCRQLAGTLTPGIGPRWDPWPYILFNFKTYVSFSFRWSSLLIKEGLVLYI